VTPGRLDHLVEVALPDADVAYSMRLDSSHVVGPLSMPAAHIGQLENAFRHGMPFQAYATT